MTHKTNADMSYEIAKVSVGAITGFPMNFTGMLPGGQYSKIANIEYTGTTEGDLYFGATFVGGGDNFEGILDVAIERVDGNGASLGWVTPEWLDATTLYTSWTKLDSNVAPGSTVRYKVYVRVDGSVGNTFQGDKAYNNVVIQAVQKDGGAQGTPANYPAN